MAKQSKWFKGDVFIMSSAELARVQRVYNPVVNNRTLVQQAAMRTKNVKGVTYSQFYERPIKPGELWD